MTLNSETESACEDPKLVTGRVEAVSNLAIVVADIANPAGGFGPAGYEQFAATFDTLVAPLAEEHFGTASDIDENGRVIILFTKEVNALDSDDDDSFTAGFFFSRDVFPKESTSPPLGSCTASNEAELLFYRATGLSPVLDLDIDDLNESETTALNNFQRLNFFRFLEFLKNPGTNLPSIRR